MKKWTEKDIRNLKLKNNLEDVPVKKSIKVEKISIEKRAIEMVLFMFVHEKAIESYVREHKFLENRRFKFDWAIPNLKIAIEYEGVISDKSRHTTINGYSGDCVKYNLAATQGWRVLRYTALNYQNFEDDLKKILEK
jgi:hypothetical protein